MLAFGFHAASAGRRRRVRRMVPTTISLQCRALS
jgi:hypothetical protein